MRITRLLGWPCYRPTSVGPPFPFRTVLINGFLGTALVNTDIASMAVQSM
jgi:hypothetical protein